MCMVPSCTYIALTVSCVSFRELVDSRIILRRPEGQLTPVATQLELTRTCLSVIDGHLATHPFSCADLEVSWRNSNTVLRTHGCASARRNNSVSYDTHDELCPRLRVSLLELGS